MKNKKQSGKRIQAFDCPACGHQYFSPHKLQELCPHCGKAVLEDGGRIRKELKEFDAGVRKGIEQATKERVAAETHTNADGYDKDGPISRPKQRKRILSVAVKWILDDSPDTSYLGEYSNRATSEFSIDREHSLDCNSINHLRDDYTYTHEEFDEHTNRCIYCDLDLVDAKKTPCSEYDFSDDCDCTGGDKGRGEFRYFNPSFNYVKKDGSPNNLTPDEVRKYTRQDYERMERLNAGDRCYIGIRAEAEIQMGPGSPIQHISSGGLWGIESDSDSTYLEKEKQNQLAELKTVLSEFGFSKRAISQAFKPENIKESE